MKVKEEAINEVKTEENSKTNDVSLKLADENPIFSSDFSFVRSGAVVADRLAKDLRAEGPQIFCSYLFCCAVVAPSSKTLRTQSRMLRKRSEIIPKRSEMVRNGRK